MENQRRYWAIRTDRRIKPLLFDELRNGRLRQGCGHHVDQDLRLIKKEIDKGGDWPNRISENQRNAIPSLKWSIDTRIRSTMHHLGAGRSGRAARQRYRSIGGY